MPNPFNEADPDANVGVRSYLEHLLLAHQVSSTARDTLRIAYDWDWRSTAPSHRKA